MSLEFNDTQNNSMSSPAWWDVFKEISWHMQNINLFMNRFLPRQHSAAMSDLLHNMLFSPSTYCDRLSDRQPCWLSANTERTQFCWDFGPLVESLCDQDMTSALDLSTGSQTNKTLSPEVSNDVVVTSKGSLVRTFTYDVSNHRHSDHAKPISLESLKNSPLQMSQNISAGFRVDQMLSRASELSYSIPASSKHKEEDYNSKREESHYTGQSNNSVCCQRHCNLIKCHSASEMVPAPNGYSTKIGMSSNDLEVDQLPRSFSPPLNFSAFTRDQNMACPICCKTFRFEKNLLRHLQKTHATGNGESVLKCKLCYYTTKHYSNMYVHIRTHTGDKPYSCSACGVSFTQGSSLKLHIKSRHQDNGQYFSLTRKPGKNSLTKLWTRVLKKDLPKYNALLRIATTSLDPYKSASGEKHKITCKNAVAKQKGRSSIVGPNKKSVGGRSSETSASFAVVESPCPYNFHYRRCSGIKRETVDFSNLPNHLEAASSIRAQMGLKDSFMFDDVEDVSTSYLPSSSLKEWLLCRVFDETTLHNSLVNGLAGENNLTGIKRESTSPSVQYICRNGAI